jgi:hypothetical protein
VDAERDNSKNQVDQERTGLPGVQMETQTHTSLPLGKKLDKLIKNFDFFYLNSGYTTRSDQTREKTQRDLLIIIHKSKKES